MSVKLALTLAKLVKLGYTALQAGFDEGFGGAEITALHDALALGDRVGRDPPCKAAAQHLAMVMAAFGQALARHGEDGRGLERSSWWRRWRSEERTRDKDIEARLKRADPGELELGLDRPDEVDAIDALRGHPLALPAYRELWRVFTDAEPAPLLALDGPGKHAFERDYLRAWHEAFESPAARPVRDWLGGLDAYRTQLVRDCVIADLATWDQRHVFGNRRRGDGPDASGMPFLPLGEMYIEPAARPIDAQGEAGEATPVQGLIDPRTAGEVPFVTVVKADFGRGKSLSARTLACRLAQAWQRDAAAPSVDTWLPIIVRCADDVHSETPRLDAIVRHALKRQAEALGISCDLDDAAFALPAGDQRTLIIIDGLDEVVFGRVALEKLFQHLRSKATDRRRVVVLTRPGVLPERRELEGIRLLELSDFDPHRVEAWLTAWNRLATREAPIEPAALAERGLGELAQTPILLLMIAQTWDEYGEAAAPSQAWLYETFFRQIARGKHERDKDHHKPIAKAAEALYARLRDTELDAAAEPVDALLWLLSRLAWKDRQKAWEQRLRRRIETGLRREAAPEPEPLTRHDVVGVLRDELGLDSDAAQAVELGVVLSLQTDLTTDRDHIHFGHKSFREFLVARYWADRLRRLVEPRLRQRERSRLVDALLDGRLLLPEDNSFELLMDLLAGSDPRAGSPFGWDETRRLRLRDWAEECFNDESMSFPDEERRTVFDDRRAVLREAALAIGSRICVLDDVEGIEADRPAVMRSMLAWFWAAREPVRVIAPRARLGAIEAGVTMRGADFRGAYLEGASFVKGDLMGTNFEGAQLSRTQFERANLDNAEFVGASLREASFVQASMFCAVLSEATLTGAVLVEAILHKADLRDADLQGTYFGGAILSEADLRGADLRTANLALSNLAGADLRAADLRGADFKGANLADTDLRGAQREGAQISDEQLASARFI